MLFAIVVVVDATEVVGGGAVVMVGATVVVVDTAVVVGVAAVVEVGAVVSELPPHPETTKKNVRTTAYFFTARVCHPSPEGRWGISDALRVDTYSV
ncbi:MAG TPA: hypothetical protein QF651_05640 [Acidimicrobiales bacterium]|nr:hypothetical protein [Acidimicrobiales bacterium]